jgi:hypothetical protein
MSTPLFQGGLIRHLKSRCIAAMTDLAFICLTILVFALIGLISKGVGRL